MEVSTKTFFYLFQLKVDRKIPHSSINIEKSRPFIEGASLEEELRWLWEYEELTVSDAARRRYPAIC